MENYQKNFEKLKLYLKENDREQFRTAFFELHKFDQGRFFSGLTESERKAVYIYLNPEEIADTFDELDEDPGEIAGYLDEMPARYAAQMLSEMFSDNEADILGVVRQDKLSRLLNYMDPSDSARIKQLLDYKDQTAGALMTTEFVSIPTGFTIGEAMHQVRQEAEYAETISYIYVVNEVDHLVGVLSVRDLIVNSDDAFIDQIMTTNVLSVDVNEVQSNIATQIRDYNFVATPVVDDKNKLLGIITVDDIIDVIDEESADDYTKLAGISSEERATSTLWASLKSRLPTLILLLLLGLLSSKLISYYGNLLREKSVLAMFMTLVMGTAGNAGTQSLAVFTSKISNGLEGKHQGRLFFNEILTAFFSGVVVGVLGYLIVGIWQQDFTEGLSIGLSIATATFLSDIFGSLIPLFLNKFKFNPSLANGPFISTLSDLTSLFVYFNFAMIFFGLMR
ncbi:magnesium transporter [Pediococcus claussenii]|uniref:Magnesium transporter MgtE n=1 Tax=Pediococcus claussenii (strain ATCC BAA-344 / DSM 14800 / JCM 18046 / KCTC 3811 / LMG 21948 / P06) TaxID=701521 RepID=G8PCS9_PEDCP|nr:magnesium transporter [Pediococcus claussenii]AEV95064.1 magnesium transporter [Pediococcus claussenii ATCC BAA-344]ANZ70252.1 magnesium transporter [Pediococcus claussenii]ANZ72068.1 magnesium transporter [Pediococcus claussenii]KRN18925.1 mgtE protein [Pediococcus claussenii]